MQVIEEIGLSPQDEEELVPGYGLQDLSLIHISEPTRLLSISYAVFCMKKKSPLKYNANSQS